MHVRAGSAILKVSRGTSRPQPFDGSKSSPDICDQTISPFPIACLQRRSPAAWWWAAHSRRGCCCAAKRARGRGTWVPRCWRHSRRSRCMPWGCLLCCRTPTPGELCRSAPLAALLADLWKVYRPETSSLPRPARPLTEPFVTIETRGCVSQPRAGFANNSVIAIQISNVCIQSTVNRLRRCLCCGAQCLSF